MFLEAYREKSEKDKENFGWTAYIKEYKYIFVTIEMNTTRYRKDCIRKRI